MLSFSLRGQDKVLVPIENIRRANELFIELDECLSIDSTNVARIESKDIQISELEAVRVYQDSIIYNSLMIEMNQDTIIETKEDVIYMLEKDIKKQKRHKIFIGIGSVLLIIVVLL